MTASTRSTARKPKGLTLTLSDRCALSYAARILYTIPVHQWSNALDMVSMVEGKPCGRDGYILGQARALWHAQSWPSEECYFASEAQLQFADETDPKRSRAATTAHWEKFIADNVAIVKAADKALEEEVAATKAA
jgi:hypothetical protein